MNGEVRDVESVEMREGKKEAFIPVYRRQAETSTQDHCVGQSASFSEVCHPTHQTGLGRLDTDRRAREHTPNAVNGGFLIFQTIRFLSAAAYRGIERGTGDAHVRHFQGWLYI